MLKIPGRRSYQPQDNHAIMVKVAATSIDDRNAKLLRLVSDKKIRLSRMGMEVTPASHDKAFSDPAELRHMLTALGRSGYIDLQGQDKMWWDFEDFTVHLTGFGEAVLAAQEVLARAGAAAKKTAARA